MVWRRREGPSLYTRSWTAVKRDLTMTDPLRPPSNALLANDEPLSDYLKRRERELVQQTAALRGMLIPKEQELANVRQAMEAVGIKRSYVEQLQPFLDQEQDEQVQPMHGLLHSESHPGILNSGPFPWELGNPLRMESLTIKEMILRALNEHFHLGATPSELRTRPGAIAPGRGLLG